MVDSGKYMPDFCDSKTVNLKYQLQVGFYPARGVGSTGNKEAWWSQQIQCVTRLSTMTVAQKKRA